VVEWFQSKSEANAVTVAEAEEIKEHWSEEPPIAACVRAYLGVKPPEKQRQTESDLPPGSELSVEQYEQLVAEMKANAAQHGVRKHG
jgi:hypothetical protein